MNEIKSAKEPTEAQIKELWEGCGLKKPHYFWRSPSGKQLTAGTPPVDLNNLFKYAVPELEYCDLMFPAKESIYDNVWHANVRYGDISARDKDENPARALFWAIYEVMKENDR